MRPQPFPAAMVALLQIPAATVRVAVVHPTLRVRTEQGLERLYSFTREAARQGTRLIVWNEGALPFDPRTERTGSCARWQHKPEPTWSSATACVPSAARATR